MTLGTTGFKPVQGDLVKILSEKYPIPKGTIARVNAISEPGSQYIIEGCENIVIDRLDLEVVAYKIQIE